MTDDETAQGYTFDIFANKMIQNMGDVANGRMRYDRVLTNIRAGVPVHAELVSRGLRDMPSVHGANAYDAPSNSRGLYVNFVIGGYHATQT